VGEKDPELPIGGAATLPSGVQEEGARGKERKLDLEMAATAVADLESCDDAPGDLTERLRPGAQLGHFLVIDRLGAGGMGVVVSAWDRKLDRKVAIKVLRPELAAAKERTKGPQRLLREAQAMAKLSHPNVITVYEVGTVGDQVFVVMEYIDGQTLGEWTAASAGKSWREIVDVFCRAGRGLAAAHAKGMVHRDFKPDNVLIDQTGRVRVTDFGLVGSVLDRAPTEPPESQSTEARALSTSLTRTGAVMGTPLYMAPEQHEGKAADPRADQFAFCVALYEALYGERPFTGDTLQDLSDSVQRGAIRDPRRAASVPLWVRTVLLRGLRTDPNDRYPSMDDLLAALSADPAAARRRRLYIAGAVALVALGVVGSYGLLRRTGATSKCKDAGQELAGVWDDDVKQAVRDAFLATGRGNAADTFERVEASLDAYAEAWVSTWTDACEATHVRGTQSDQLLDRRMTCLDRRRGQLEALTELFAEQPDADLVDSAAKTAQELEPLEVCSDTDALLAEVPPPSAPETRAEVDDLRARLDRAHALQKAGKYDEGLQQALAIAKDAERVEYHAVRAEALYRLGTLQRRSMDTKSAEQTLRRAAVESAAAHDDRLTAKIWIESLFVIGYLESRFDEVPTLATIAESAVERARTDDDLRAELQNARAAVLTQQGKYADAEKLFAEVLASRERADGPEHIRVAAALNNLAIALSNLGKNDEALAAHRRALAIKEKVYGPDHPEVAGTLQNMGAILHEEDHYDEALELLRRALAIQQKVMGENHPRTADPLNSIGLVLKDQGKLEEAIDDLERALALREESLGPESPTTASSLSNLGLAWIEAKDYNRALDYLQRSLAIREKVLGPDHPTVAESHNNLSIVYKRLGDFDKALEHQQRAVEIREKALGPDHPAVANALNNIGYMFYQQERFRDARPYYERAAAIYEKNPNAPMRATALLFYGDVQRELQDFDGASKSFSTALELAEKHYGADDIHVVVALTGLGSSLVDLRKPDEAVEPLDRALAILDRREKEDDPTYRAAAEFHLARALWDQQQDLRRAMKLARKARDVFAKDPEAKRLLGAVNTWMRTR